LAPSSEACGKRAPPVIRATAQEDVFVFDRVLTTRERAGLAADGSQLDGHSPVSGISADGHRQKSPRK
jgi:hypothetical protein